MCSVHAPVCACVCLCYAHIECHVSSHPSFFQWKMLNRVCGGCVCASVLKCVDVWVCIHWTPCPVLVKHMPFYRWFRFRFTSTIFLFRTLWPSSRRRRCCFSLFFFFFCCSRADSVRSVSRNWRLEVIQKLTTNTTEIARYVCVCWSLPIELSHLLIRRLKLFQGTMKI